MQNNNKLIFIPETHKYTYNGEELISTTTLIQLYEPKFDPDGSILIKNAEEKGVKPEDLKKEWEKTRVDAAERGTNFHREMEKFIKTKKINKTSKNKDLINEFSKIKFDGKIEPEKKIFSTKYKIAGTVDLVVKKKNGLSSIFDAKTNKKKPNNSSYFNSKMLYPINHLPHSKLVVYGLQLSIYAIILEEEYGFFIDDLTLLYVDFKKRKIIPIPVPYMREDSLKIINHYNSNLTW